MWHTSDTLILGAHHSNAWHTRARSTILRSVVPVTNAKLGFLVFNILCTTDCQIIQQTYCFLWAFSLFLSSFLSDLLLTIVLFTGLLILVLLLFVYLSSCLPSLFELTISSKKRRGSQATPPPLRQSRPLSSNTVLSVTEDISQTKHRATLAPV